MNSGTAKQANQSLWDILVGSLVTVRTMLYLAAFLAWFYTWSRRTNNP
jgi:hypothetical protein